MRRVKGRVLVFALLFFLSMTIFSGMAEITQSTAMEVQHQQIQFNSVEQARGFYLAGEYQKAREMWQQAVTEFSGKNQPLNEAMALSNLSLTYQQLGQWKQAEEALQQSLNRLDFLPKLASPNQLRLLAQVLSIQGNFYLETGNPEQALSTWEKATEYYTQISDKNSIDQSLINQAQALQILGFYPRACQRLIKALDLKVQTCKWSSELQEKIEAKPVDFIHLLAFRQLGEVFRVLGDFPASSQVLLTALKQAERLNNPEQISAVYLGLGKTKKAEGNNRFFDKSQAEKDFEAAIQYYRKVIETTTQPLLQTQAKVETLQVLIQTQNGIEYQDLISEIKENFPVLPLNQSGINTQIRLTEILLDFFSNQLKFPEQEIINSSEIQTEIQQILTRVTEQSQAINSQSGLAYSWGLQGKLYELQQEWNQAENATIQALNSLKSYQSQPDISYQFLWQLGRIRKATGKRELAISNYTQAVNLLQGLRQDIIATDLDNQFNFQENIEPVYRGLIDLRLQRADQTKSDLRESINLIEALQIEELNNFFRIPCVQDEDTQIEQADPSAAIFYPIILQDRLEVIIALPGQPLEHYSSPIAADEVKNINLQIRRNLGILFNERDILPQTQKLYNWLIRPVETQLKNNQIKTLVFVLDGALRNIPMSFLQDGEQYLIENYNIAIALPGLKLQNSNPFNSQTLKLLIGGLSEASQNFPPLPSIQVEIENLSQQFPASKILLNDQFTTPNLQNQMSRLNVPIIHLATHGQFSSNREDTFILTINDKIKIDDFEKLLETRQVNGISPIELLVLSACQTASGDNRATLGLAGVAVRSGARSTLATLWSVNDQSTAELIEIFYQKLTQPNISKAEALRLAQLDLIKRGYRKPCYWAPFILVGSWF